MLLFDRLIVGGFSNPIDAEIIGNRVYAIEYGSSQGIWEITFPPASPAIILSAPAVDASGAFDKRFTAISSISTSNWSTMVSFSCTPRARSSAV